MVSYMNEKYIFSLAGTAFNQNLGADSRGFEMFRIQLLTTVKWKDYGVE